jgi:hypothetical protein
MTKADVRQLPTNPRVTYRTADQADLVDFYGKRPDFSIKAIIFFLDDKPAAIGGWKIEGGNYAVFSEIKDDVKVEKSTIFRCARLVLDFISEKGCPMYASTHNPRFLERLGFTKLETVTNSEEFYVWQN